MGCSTVPKHQHSSQSLPPSPMSSFFTLLAVAILALATTLTLAAECNTTASNLTASYVDECEAVAGFSITNVSASIWTNETLRTAFCASNACQNMISEIEAVWTNECTIDGVQLYHDVINPLVASCSGASAKWLNVTHKSTAAQTTSQGSSNSSTGSSSSTASSSAAARTTSVTMVLTLVVVALAMALA